MFFVQQKELLRKTSLEAYSRPRINGVNAITVREGDELLEARMTNGQHHIMLAIKIRKSNKIS